MEPSILGTNLPRRVCQGAACGAIVGVWLLLCGAPLGGQEPSPGPVAQAAASDSTKQAAPVPVGRAELDTWMVPDQDGALIKFFEFPYEELLELWRIKEKIENPDARPRYSLQRLDISGEAAATHATLHVELTVRLETDQPVKVPLGLRGAFPVGPLASVSGPTQELPGQEFPEQFLHYDEADEMYVVWLRGEPQQERKLALDVLVPITSGGSETVLRLATPRAAISRLTLKVDGTDAVARVSEGAAIVSTRATDDGRTEFIVQGVGGQTELAWHKAGQQGASVLAVLEASGAILTTIEGHSAHSEARLSVRSFGGTFDRFRVRLPPGALLVGGGEPGYTLEPVDRDVSDGSGQLVDVKLDRPTSGPSAVRLVTEHRHDLDGSEDDGNVRDESEDLLQLGGFEVVGAGRQFGHIAVRLFGQWQLNWIDQQNVRRVADLPEFLRRDDVVAGFEYYRQPFRLDAGVAPRETQIRVSPQFQLTVGANRATLKGRLQYTVHGGQVFTFDVDLRGWQWDLAAQSVGPDNLVDIEAVTVDSEGILHVPLNQPTTAPVELLFEAYRDITADEQMVEFPIPLPLATTRTPATLLVLPGENAVLTPVPEKMVGLTPQPLGRPGGFSSSRPDSLSYHADRDQATFVATIEVPTQSVAVDVLSQVSADERDGQVDQTLAFDVAYAAIGSLLLDVPLAVAESGELDITLGGRALEPVDVSEIAPSLGNRPSRLMRVDLPTPRIGRFELRIRYPLAGHRLESEQDRPVVVPLVMPTDGEVGKMEAIVLATGSVAVAPIGNTWTEAIGGAGNGRAGDALRLVSDGRQSRLPLSIRLVKSLATVSTIAERSWLQTTLTSSARRDRAVYRLATDQSQIEISLPAGVLVGAVDIKLDGRTVRAETVVRANNEGDVIVVRLPSAAAWRNYQLELRYDVPDGGIRTSRLNLDRPRLEGVRTRHVYWQLVLPRDVHLISAPTRFTPEYVWNWQGLYWGRRSTMEQRELEEWSGAIPDKQAAASANRYLLSTLDGSTSMTIQTARRSSILLVGAGATLLIGLLIIYFPISRRAGVLFSASVVLLAAGIWYPEPALLVAQAATLGLVLTLLAGFLRYVTTPWRPRGVVARDGGISVSGSSPTIEAYAAARAAQRVLDNDSSGTATTTISLETSDSDS